jgi:hypothetical protein
MLPEYIDRESCDSYLVILIVKGGGRVVSMNSLDLRMFIAGLHRT